jgi:hypothetical protein
MPVKTIAVALIVTPLILGAACGAADAQPLPGEVVGLPPRVIVAMLRSDGFAPLGRPVRGEGVFFVRALDPDDNDVRLTIDARTGRILAARSMIAMAPLDQPPVYGAYPGAPRRQLPTTAGFADVTGALPVPPKSVPSGSAAHKTPLPRPRPQAIAAVPAAPPVAAPPVKPAEAVLPKGSDAAPPATAGKVEFPPVTPLE